jgi:integrase/recombinase XerD
LSKSVKSDPGAADSVAPDSSSGADDRLLEAFLDSTWSERGLSAATLEAYRDDLRCLSSSHRLDGVSREQLLSFLSSRLKAGDAVSTLTRRISCYRQFFAWARRQGLVADNPTLDIEAPKRHSRLPEVLTSDQIQALLAQPDPRHSTGAAGSRDPRDTLCLRCAGQ